MGIGDDDGIHGKESDKKVKFTERERSKCQNSNETNNIISQVCSSLHLCHSSIFNVHGYQQSGI